MLFGIGRFEIVDLRRLFHGQADIVETVEHAVAAELIKFESDRAAIRDP